MTDTASAQDDLIPLRQAARALGVPATWLRQEVDDGRLPGLRAGASILLDLATIRRLLLERARGADGVPTSAANDEGQQ